MKKYIIGFIIGGIVCTTIGVSATLMYQANQIIYTKSNNQEVTLDTALNELYSAASYDEYNGTTSFTPSESTQTIATNNKLLKSNLTINSIPSAYKNMESLELYVQSWNNKTTTIYGGMGISAFAPYFKYFKITSAQTVSGTSNICRAQAYSVIAGANEEIAMNTKYNVASTTDGKNYTEIKAYVSSTSTAATACRIYFTLYN